MTDRSFVQAQSFDVMVASYAHSRHGLLLTDAMAGPDLRSPSAASANRRGLQSLALAQIRRSRVMPKALCWSNANGAGLKARVVTHSTANQGVHNRDSSNFMSLARDALA